jgi:hypothetical protein
VEHRRQIVQDKRGSTGPRSGQRNGVLDCVKPDGSDARPFAWFYSEIIMPVNAQHQFSGYYRESQGQCDGCHRLVPWARAFWVFGKPGKANGGDVGNGWWGTCFVWIVNAGSIAWRGSMTALRPSILSPASVRIFHELRQIDSSGPCRIEIDGWFAPDDMGVAM